MVWVEVEVNKANVTTFSFLWKPVAKACFSTSGSFWPVSVYSEDGTVPDNVPS